MPHERRIPSRRRPGVRFVLNAGTGHDRRDLAVWRRVLDKEDPDCARLRKLLDDVRVQSERPPQPAPAGIDPREAAALREMQNKLIANYDVQSRTLDRFDRTRALRQAMEARERNWIGFDTPPPYSMLRLDELRDAAETARDRIGLIETSLAQFPLDAESARDELNKTEETLDLAREPDARERAVWRREVARLRASAAAAAVTTIGLSKEMSGDSLALRHAEAKLLERQIAVASQNAACTEADLARAQTHRRQDQGRARCACRD